MENKKRILDACCGSKMFWYDKNDPDVVFMDFRKERCTLCDGRTLEVNPDLIADFRNIPFPDETFYVVVFDPPHLIHAGENSWVRKKYGILPNDWESYLREGFCECKRVLKKNGVLVFKWSEDQIKTADVLKALGENPYFGDKRSKTRWMFFMK